MNVGSLFSGIGGLDHGLARAGLRHVFFCEADPWRREVLAARWPGVPIWDDVRSVGRQEHGGEFRGDDGVTGGERRRQGLEPELRAVDLLCGGFPCQDLSVAGQRRGLAGERSGLFHQFARIIESFRPGWVLVENVPGLLSSNGGRDFGIVIGTLADLGYGVAWRVLDSRFFGVPQRRRRVFILGALAETDPAAAADRAGQVLAVGTRCPGHPPTGTQAGEDTSVASLSGLGTGGPDDNDGQANRVIAIAAPLTKGSATGKGVNPPGRRQEDDVNIVATSFHMTQEPIHGEEFTPAIGKTSIGMGVSNATGVRRLTPVECERLQGLPDDWTRLDARTPDSRRYSALGDAVTANVAEWIGSRLLAAGDGQP